MNKPGVPGIDLESIKPFSCSGNIRQDDVVDGNHTTAIVACGCVYFRKVMQLRALSRLVSPTGQDMLAEVPYYQCVVCGSVYTTAQVHGGEAEKPSPVLVQ